MTKTEKVRKHYKMYAIPFRSIVRHSYNDRIHCTFYGCNNELMFNSSAKTHKSMDRLINRLYNLAMKNNPTEYGI